MWMPPPVRACWSCCAIKTPTSWHAAALQSGLDEAAANALTAILSLHGPFGTTLAAARSQCQCEAQQDALLELQSLQNELGDAGRGMQLDLSLAGDMEYYNGLVFSGYVAGVPRAVLKGGRYEPAGPALTPVPAPWALPFTWTSWNA